MKRPSRRVLSVSIIVAVALTLAIGASAAPAPVPNPGFETPNGAQPAQWVSGGTGNFTRDTAVFHAGAASLNLGVVMGAFSVNSDCFAVSANTLYYLSYWYRTNDANVNTVTGAVRWFTDAACSNILGGDLDATTTATIDTSWHRFQGSGTSPATGVFASVKMQLNCDIGQSSCSANYDDVLLDTVPTAVTVSSLAARRSNAGVDVTWRTGGAANTLGFNVWRSGSRAGAYTKLNRSVIAALGTPYRYRDRTARAGTRYFYKLQVVRLDGSRAWVGAVALTG